MSCVWVIQDVGIDVSVFCHALCGVWMSFVLRCLMSMKCLFLNLLVVWDISASCSIVEVQFGKIFSAWFCILYMSFTCYVTVKQSNTYIEMSYRIVFVAGKCRQRPWLQDDVESASAGAEASKACSSWACGGSW